MNFHLRRLTPMIACAVALSGMAPRAFADDSNTVTYENVAVSSSDQTTNSVCCGGRPTSLESKVNHETVWRQVWTADPGAASELAPGVFQSDAQFRADWTDTRTTVTINKGWAECRDGSMQPSEVTVTQTSDATASLSGIGTILVRRLLLDLAGLTDNAASPVSFQATQPDQLPTGTATTYSHSSSTAPCGSSAKSTPDQSSSGPWTPSATMVHEVLGSLQGDPDSPDHIVGSQVQTLPFENGTQTVTTTWDVGTTPNCATRQAELELATVRLQADVAGLKMMIDSFKLQADGTQAMAIASAPVPIPVPGLDLLMNELAQFGASGLGDSAFANDAGAWAAGPATQQIAQLSSQVGTPGVGGMIAESAMELQDLQKMATTAGADANALAQAKASLAGCQ